MLVRTETFRSGTPGALPAYSSASTAVSSATLAATHAVNYPATVTAGDLLIAVAVGVNQNNNADVAMHADLIAAGFEQLIKDSTDGNAVTGLIAWKRAVGTEDGTSIANAFTGSGGTTTDGIRTQMYRFTAADGFHAEPAVDVHIHTDGEGFDAAVAMPTVTPTGINQLAVAIIVAFGNFTASSSTGESGGDWTSNVSAAANNCGLHVQTSNQSGGGSISGGSAAFGGSVLPLAFGFALRPADV